ncbi:MAG: hypothetical protein WC076_11725 [Terrimicrobiaceae bacterium]
MTKEWKEDTLRVALPFEIEERVNLNRRDLRGAAESAEKIGFQAD